MECERKIRENILISNPENTNKSQNHKKINLTQKIANKPNQQT